MPRNCDSVTVTWRAELAESNCERGTSSGTAASAAGRKSCPMVAVRNVTA